MDRWIDRLIDRSLYIFWLQVHPIDARCTDDASGPPGTSGPATTASDLCSASGGGDGCCGCWIWSFYHVLPWVLVIYPYLPSKVTQSLKNRRIRVETHLPTISNPSDLQELCFGVMAIWFSSKQWDFSSKVWDFSRIYYMGIRMAKKRESSPWWAEFFRTWWMPVNT